MKTLLAICLTFLPSMSSFAGDFSDTAMNKLVGSWYSPSGEIKILPDYDVIFPGQAGPMVGELLSDKDGGFSIQSSGCKFNFKVESQSKDALLIEPQPSNNFCPTFKMDLKRTRLLKIQSKSTVGECVERAG